MDGQEEEEELDMDGPMMIDRLQEKGINKGDIDKLKLAGFSTVESIAFTPKKTLIQIKGMSEAKIDKVIEAAHSLVKLGFQTATTFF